MKGSQIPSSHPKSHPYYPLASHSPASSSSFPLEDSDSSLRSLEARDSSIRIVKPNLTLSPPQKPKDEGNDKNATGHFTSNQAGKSQPGIM